MASSDTPSVTKQLSHPSEEGPVDAPASPETTRSKRAAFFDQLKRKRSAEGFPRSFSKWSGSSSDKSKNKDGQGKNKPKTESAKQELEKHKKSRREKGEDEEDNAGHNSDDDGTDGGGKGANEPGFRVKTRYSPIISGLFCPFSVLLDIPGLTERVSGKRRAFAGTEPASAPHELTHLAFVRPSQWYVKTSNGTVVDTQPNTTLLDAALGLSIAFGLIANIALIGRFLEKKPYPTTLVAIVALTIHDCINIATLIDFGVVHAVDDGFTVRGRRFFTHPRSPRC